MPIRIQFEHTLYSHWGGRSGYTQFLRHLDPRRYLVEVQGTPDSDECDQLPSWLSSSRPWVRCWTRQCGGMPWYKLVDLAAELRVLESCRANQVDIVHFLDGEHSAQFLPRVIKVTGLSAVRTIATFHQPPEWAAKVINGNLLRWLDAVLLVAPSQLSFFKRFLPEHRIHVLLHGVDAEFFRPAAYQNRSQRVRCITTGHWLRDWQTFRAVAQALTNISFDVVTSNENAPGDLPNVKVYKGINDNELADLYRNADILFLPLTDSTANNTLLEGIASGLPVVTADLEAVRAYLPNGEGILVPAGRPAGFIEALQRLEQDVDLRREIGRRARARAEELAWPRLVRRYESFYESVLQHPPPRGAEGSLRFYNLSGKHPQWPRNERKNERPNLAVHVVDADQLALRGQLLFTERLYRQAADVFGILALRFSDDHRGYIGLARTAEAQWDWTAAIEQWARCIRILRGSQRVKATAQKAHCLIQIGSIDQARTLYGSMKDQFEGAEGLAQIAEMQDMELATNLWEMCTKGFPDRLDGFLGRAVNLVNRSYNAEAEALLSQVISVWPNSRRAGALWAELPAVNGDWTTAAARWRTVLAKHAGNGFVSERYARYLARCNDAAEVDAYGATLKDPIALTGFLLEYYVARDDYQGGIEQARKLVVWRGEDLAYQLRLAVLLTLEGSRVSARESMFILRNLHAHSPESILIKSLLIAACVNGNLNKQAKKLLQSIPHTETRIEVQLLRTWARHQADADYRACNYWRTVFLDFGIFRASKLVAAGFHDSVNSWHEFGFID